MKKIYIAPEVELTMVDKASIICTSETISKSTTGIDGGSALSKERYFDFSDEDIDF